MARSLRWLLRVGGFALVAGAAYPFLTALRMLDHRDYVGALLATLVGWLITQAGVEFLRPESAE